MNGDSDDEISELRTAALLTRSSNMRKRKVTLINRNVTAEENDGDKRHILVNTRTVVIGRKSDSPIQSQKVSTTASKNRNSSDSHWPTAVMDTIDSYAPKKPKLQNDRRILSVTEKHVKTRKDQRIFTVSGESRNENNVSSIDEDIDLETDVRIIVSDDDENGLQEDVNEQSELIEIEDVDELEYAKENTVVDEETTNDEVEEVTGAEEKLASRNIETKTSEGKTEMDEGDIERDEEEEEVEENEEEGIQALEEGPEKDQREQEVEEEQNEKGNEGQKETNKKGKVKVVKEGEKESVSRKEQKEKRNVQGVKDRKSVETTNKKVENKEGKTGKPKTEVKLKDEFLKQNQKTAETTSNAKEHEQKKSAQQTAEDGSYNESSGSESDSSRSSGSSSSSSSSSYSSSSSSSRTSSNSRSSSGSKSDSNSDDEKESTGKHSSRSKHTSRSKHSSRSSSHSSSYSYSTGGSAEKITLRSVVSQKDKDSRHSRSSRLSPRRPSPARWSPRDRRYPDRQRSYDSGDRYRKAGRDDERPRREVSPVYPRRRSPRSRLGRRNPSPPRFYRRDRDRSREHDKTRNMWLNKPDERSRRRRTRSKSFEKKKDTSASDKNNLSRTDDDFVEIDVRQKPEIRESRRKNSGRLKEERINANGRKGGFDLRSKLGAKKTEKKLVITKKPQVDAQQNVGRKTRKGKEIAEQKKQEVVEVVEIEEEEGQEEVYEEDDEESGQDEEQVDEEYETSPSLRKTVVKVQDDKEAELDVKILRIQRMNEAIRKRQEEIEREKMIYVD